MSNFLNTLKRSRLASSAVALVLAFSVLLSTFGGLSIFAGQTSDVWGGEVATAFASGTGTDTDPYVIATGGQLRLMVEQGAESAGKYYKLANDIYLNDVTTQNWYQGGSLNSWNQMAVNEDNAFRGNFNGAGHKVFGLYLNYKTANTTPTTNAQEDHDIDVAAGLIPVVGKGAVIDAVGVEKANITIKNSVTGNDSAVPAGFVGAVVGAFIGNNASNTVSVSRCYAADTVALTGAFVGLIGGGAAANGEGVTVENCYSLLSWTVRISHDENNRAGLIGRQPGGATFSGCFALGNVAGTIVNKGAVNNYVTGWNSSAGTVVTVSDIYGGEAAKTAMPELDWENVYMTTSSHPILRTFYVPSQGGEGGSTTTGQVWDGSKKAPTVGTGTSTDPYIISTAEELAFVVANGGGAGKFYKLAADIYLNEVSSVNWTNGQANGSYTPNVWFTQYDQDGTSYNGGNVFKGTLDGAGFTVYGLYYRPGDPNSAAALIPVANGATVKNIRLAKSFVSGGRWTAALMGYSTGCTVQNVVIDKTVTVWAYNAGNKYVAQTHIDKAAAEQDAWPFYVRANGGSFQSCGAASVVAYAISSINMSNVADYATIKQDGHAFTTTNPLTNGGNPVTVGHAGHNGGLIGTAWNTAITVTDCISVSKPFDGENGSGSQNFTDVYTFGAGVPGKYSSTTVTDTSITGEKAKNTLSGFDFDAVWATTEGYPTLKIFNKMSPDEYWSGAEVAPTVGTGTSTDPYIISTAEELAYVVKNGMESGKFYELANDIYLNDITQIDWATGTANGAYEPKQWYTYTQCGTLAGNFNGNAHKVYGLYIKNTTTNAWGLDGAALFPKASNGLSISKLGVDCAYVRFHKAAAAILGGAAGAMTVTIDQCYVGSAVTIDGTDAGAIVGANTATLNLTNSYGLATTIGHKISATEGGNTGLVGEMYTWAGSGSATSSITNCYNATGKISKNAASVAFTNNFATVEQTGVTVLEASAMQGLTVMDEGGAMAGLGDKFQATTTYPILTAFAPVKPAPETGVWDGTSKTAPSEGVGTEASPFIIYNAAELAYVLTNDNGGLYYKLANDIFINDVDKVNWETGEAIGTYKINSWLASGKLTGHLDGDGHTVYGLYYKTGSYTSGVPAVSGRGLIPSVGDGFSVKNLGIDKAYAEHYASYSFAAMIGQVPGNVSGSVTNSYVGKNVTVKGYDAAAFFGGGPRNGGALITVDHCYSLATISYVNRGGAFYGDSWANTGETGRWQISNSYAIGNFSYVGGNKSFTNCFATAGAANTGLTIVDETDLIGLDVFNNGKPAQMLNKDKAWEVTNSYPILDLFAETSGKDGEEYVPESDVDANGIWKGIIAETFSDNTSVGSENDPIILTTPGELALAISSGGLGKYYKLANDMYLNDVSTKIWHTKDTCNPWLTNGEFNGHIDGAGNIVYGIWYSGNTTGAVGLIPKMGSGSVKNIGVRYSVIRSSQNLGAGGIIGYAANVIDVDKCFVDDSVQISSTTAGGIVGLAQQNNKDSTKGLVITNCYSKAPIKSNSGTKANGLIGNPWVTAYEIRDSYSVGIAPYQTSGGGGKSSIYWTHKMKFDGTTWVTDYSVPKEGKNAADCFSDIYSDRFGADNVDHFWTTVDKADMYGQKAKTTMSGLDFKNVFLAVDDGTPILKIFEGKVTGEDIDLSADSEIFSSGKGTQKNPYLIKNAEQLAYLVQSENTAGKYYKLANDIYINDTTKKNWKTNAKLWYSNNSAAAFQGHLEGDGHSIHGIYINETPKTQEELGESAYYYSGAGLFGFVHIDAVIRNVHIRDSYISGVGCVGAIAGHIAGGQGEKAEILGCSSDESVVLRGFTVGGIAGGGNGCGVELYFCYSTADIGGTGTSDRMNSMIGDMWSVSNDLLECYGQGLRMMRGGAGTMYNNYSDTFSSVVTVVPKASMYGAKAKTAMPKLSWGKVWYTEDGKTPQLKVIPEGTYPIATDEGKKGRVWSGMVATKFAGGTGTEDDPYLIETPEQMAYLIYKGSKAGAYYKLIADLKLNDTSKPGWTENANEWFTGKKFSGHFDGNGHVVSGLYYNQTDAPYCGLFPEVAGSSTIKRIGVIESYLANYATVNHAYAGAIAGFLSNWDGYMGASLSPDGVTNLWGEVAPVFSECFVDDTVELEGDTVGGIFAGAACGVEIYNCYATCTLTGTYRAGGIFGDNWENNEGISVVLTSYSATTDRDAFGGGPKKTEQTAVYDSLYCDGDTIGSNANRLSIYYMQSERAKAHMPEFDYENIWKTVPGGTPVLRCFKNAEQYSCGREPQKVSISFVTGDGGSQHEPVMGLPLIDKINYDEWPTPTRYGYEFVRWHHYDSFDLPFELENFPNYDCLAFAEWKPTGFTQGWEGNNSSQYDINSGAAFYQPGVAGYNPRYIHGGLRSLKTLVDGEDQPMFLLSYETKLEVGKEYDVNFWMTSRENGAAGTIEVFHSNYADVNDTYIGYQKGLEFKDLQGGVWKQYQIKVVANGPYLMFRTPVGVELYFDDVQVVPTGKEGEIGNLEGFNPGEISNEPKDNSFDMTLIWIIVGVAGGVVLLGGAAVTTVVLVKKGKGKKTPPTAE